MAAHTREEIQAWLVSRIAARLGVEESQVDASLPFERHGVSSREAVVISGELEDWLGLTLPPTLLYEHPDIAALAVYLAGQTDSGAGPAPSPTVAASAEPIAIVGLGCRVPGAAGPEAFWDLLARGVDAIREVPADRWDLAALYDPDPSSPGKVSTRHAGLVDGIDRFDHRYFGISPREAAAMDPQQRLLLEVAHEALEDAGQDPARLAGTHVGVFVGIATGDYARVALADPARIEAHSGTGLASSVAANRISYLLDLRGPSVAVDSACSSSLLALHLAVQSLRAGESTLALVGGVNALLSPEITINFSRAGVMAPDGRCKFGDARANGYVRGEGAGVLVLKPLSRALADGDPIRAVVRGTAANQDGRTNGLMAPNPAAQEAVLREAYQRAGVQARDVKYVEAHGTGTMLGDRIEIGALSAVLGEGRAPGLPRCALGSVKTNIGHLEAAAGVVGVVKVALALQRRAIPPSLHFQAPNPHLDFAALPVEIRTALGPWPEGQGPLLAGVSSFGFGGTNVHAVLEEAPPPAPRPAGRPGAVHLLPISARSEVALAALAQAHAERLEGPGPDVADLAFTAGARRGHHPHRLVAAGRSRAELRDALLAHVRGEAHPALVSGRAAPGRRRRLAFVFPGQGAQWLGMGRALAEAEPAFRAALESVDRAMAGEIDFSVLAELAADEGRSRLGRIEVVQPVLFAMQYALAALFRSWGVEPDAVVGHSMGEVAAAAVAGALALEDAARVVCRRSRLMARESGRGAMALVELSLEAAQRAIEGHEARVSVAASNGARSTVLSGDPDALREILARLEREGVFCRAIKVDVASHSPGMEPLRGELEAALSTLGPRAAAIPICSTVTGSWIDGAALDARYWGRNLREPVLFAPAVGRLLDGGFDLFLELTPHPVLLASLEQELSERGGDAVALATLRRGADEPLLARTSLGALHAAGLSVDLARLHPEGGRCVPLPAYPWDHAERCWVEDAAPRAAAGASLGAQPAASPWLGVRFRAASASAPHVFEVTLDRARMPELAAHRVRGSEVVPASVLVEMLRGAACEALGIPACRLSDVAFRQPVVLADDGTRRVQVTASAAGAGELSLELHAWADSGAWSLHVEARAAAAGDPGADRRDLGALRGAGGPGEAGSALYAELERRGVGYGPPLLGATELWRLPGGILAALGGAASAPKVEGVPVAALDACFHLAAAGAPGADRDRETICVPAAVGGVSIRQGGPGAQARWVHARFGAPGVDGAIAAGVELLDGEGNVLAALEGLELRRVRAAPLRKDAGSSRLTYAARWAEPAARRPTSPAATSAGRSSEGWLLVAEPGPVATALAAQLAAAGVPCAVATAGERFSDVEGAGRRLTFRPGVGEDAAQVLDRAGAARVAILAAPEAGASAAPRVAARALTVSGFAAALAARPGKNLDARLWIATVGAQPVGGAAEALDPLQAPLWGLARVLGEEHPELLGGLVDLDPAAPADLAAAQLAEELRAGPTGEQVGYRGGVRRVLRLERLALGGGSTPAFRPDGLYLVTGGLGDLGCRVARWLVENGARAVALLSRGGVPDRAAWAALAPDGAAARRVEAVRALESLGARVFTPAVDVSDPAALAGCLAALRAESGAPVVGVFHAAGVARDQRITALGSAELAEVLRPKIEGALSLSRLLAGEPLEHFVLFSSAGATLPFPGQASYAAANAFLDSLAAQRRAGGLPGLSVGWGAWEGLGLALTEGGRQVVDRLGARGVRPLGAAAALEAMGALLTGSEPHALVLDVDWRAYRAALAGTPPPILEGLAEVGPAPAAGGTLRAELAAAPLSGRRALLELRLKELVGRVLKLPPGRVDAREPFAGMGMDSILAMELRNRLQGAFGRSFPATLAFSYPTVGALAEHLMDGIGDVPAAAAPQPTGDAPAKAEPVRVEPAPPPVLAPLVSPIAGEPIAIVGMACRFPGGASDPRAFWELLRQGRDAITEVPPDRFPIDGLYDPDPAAPGKMSTRFGGFLAGVDRFDAAFFGISPREAAAMDPQQRLLLEVAWEALEDGGQSPERIGGLPAGVFMGIYYGDYGWLQFADAERIEAYTATGNAHSVAVGRLSYLLDLRGPAVAVDTACSSSLTAVHLACQSLRTGETRLAVAGGVNVMLSPEPTISFSKWGMMAPDGRCKSFDASANGFVRGEGCGVVVLKRLRDAVADGDPIWAVVRGTAVNQDGRSNGLTAPSGKAQQAVLRQALAMAGLPPERVGLIEAHGTGTSLGDPIEVEAIAAVYGAASAAAPTCALGAVKTNFGHLEAAAGVAGLIKAVLSLHERTLPPNLHFRRLNPAITLDGTRLAIPTRLEPWAASGLPRCAAVSSFGFGGTNAHVVLEEAPAPAVRPSGAPATPRLFPLSARSPEALRDLARAHAAALVALPDGDADLDDLCHTASLRRGHHDRRLAVVATTRAQLEERLAAFARDGAAEGVLTGQAGDGDPRPVFVFPGQGGQWAGMGRALLAQEPAFREAIDACEEAFRPFVDWSLGAELRADEAASRLAAIDVVQPVLFATEVALAALWRAWGIAPAAVVGHSMGEVAAAHVAGALSLSDAARIICRRSQLMRRVSGRGAMGLVGLSMEEVAEALRPYGERVSIAASNGPRSTVISGETAAVHAVLGAYQARNVFCRPIQVDVASHSAQVEPLREELLRELAGVRPGTAAIPLHSTVLGRLVAGPELTAEYWVRNLREPVLFSGAVTALAAEGRDVFVEVSPHPTLLPAVEQALSSQGVAAALVPSLERGQDERASLLGAAAALYCRGAAPAWERLAPAPGRAVRLPTYPWQRRRHWLAAPAPAPGGRSRARAEGGHPLLERAVSVAHPPGTRLWETELSLDAHPWLADHQVQGALLAPASLLLEMALAGGRREGAPPMALRDFRLHGPLVLDRERPVALQLIAGADGGVQLHARARGAEGWTALATGRHAPAEALAPSGDLQAVRARCSAERSAAEFQAQLAAAGFGYGPAFQGLRSLAVGDGEALAVVEAPPALTAGRGGWLAHPALLDACLQVIGAALPAGAAAGKFLFAGVEGLTLSAPLPERLLAHVRCARAGTDREGLRADVRLLSEDGAPLAALSGVRVEPVSEELVATLKRASAGASAGAAQGGWHYRLAWREVPPVSAPPPDSGCAWLIVGDGRGVGAGLREALEARGERAWLALPRGAAAPGALGFAPESREGVRELLEEVDRAAGTAGPRRWRIVHLMGLDLPEPGGLPEAERAGPAAAAALAALRVAQVVSEAPWAGRASLRVVTRGAQPIEGDGGPASLLQAPLWGLGRGLRVEVPAAWAGLVDLDPARPDGEVAALLAELGQDGAEDEVVLRRGVRRVPRLHRAEPAPSGGALSLRSDGTYLVVGGLGPLGLRVARLLVDHGARHLLLLGRRGLPGRDEWAALPAGDPLRETVEAVLDLERAGAAVHVAAADAGDPASLRAALGACGTGLPPLRGVVNAAFAGGPRAFGELEPADVEAMFRAKVAASLALDAVTADLPLDLFVLFSSTTALWGSRDLAHYAAASQLLEALAHDRRRRGRPALCINWGAWENLGGASADAQKFVEASGLRPMAYAPALAALRELLAAAGSGAAPVQAVVAAVEWERFLAVYQARRALPLLEELQHEVSRAPVAQVDPALAARLAAAAPEERVEVWTDLVQAEAARVLRLERVAELDPDRGFFQLGMDSMTAAELRRRLQGAAGRPLPMTLVFEHPTVRALARHLAAVTAPAAGSSAAVPHAEHRAAPAPIPAPAPATPESRESELLARLASKVKRLQTRHHPDDEEQSEP